MEPIKEVKIEKTFDAPPETIWQAWTDPEIIKKWWGPEGVTAPEAEVDLKVGGRIYIVMEAGEAMGPYKGTLWPMLGEFTVVEPNSKLAYKAQAWTEGPQKEETMIDQTTEMTLTGKDGKTRLNLRAAIYKMGPAASMAAEGMEWGFKQQLEKLENLVRS